MAVRKYGTDIALPVVQRIAKVFTFEDEGTFVVGTLPEGACVVRAYCIVTTAFNSGSSDVIDCGIQGGDVDAFLDNDSIATAGLVQDLTALHASDELYSATEQVVQATYTSSGTAPTAGRGVVCIEFINRYEEV